MVLRYYQRGRNQTGGRKCKLGRASESEHYLSSRRMEIGIQERGKASPVEDGGLKSSDWKQKLGSLDKITLSRRMGGMGI